MFSQSAVLMRRDRALPCVRCDATAMPASGAEIGHGGTRAIYELREYLRRGEVGLWMVLSGTLRRKRERARLRSG
eukprot:1994909-Rhodomonas_salina.2